MEYYVPYFTEDKRVKVEQAFLNQVLLPQISNTQSDIYKFFKSGDYLELENLKNKNITNKIICLNPKFECDFESYARHAKTKERDKHVEFMEKIKPEQLAALYPYARFYVVDTKHKKVDVIKKNAIPISFGKSFDLDFFQKNLNTTSRGEGAGLLSITSNRVYDITGDYDPIALNASFFFSSYEVFINKPAIEKSSLRGVSYDSNLQGGATFSGFFNKVNNVTYKELVARRNEFKLLLEYGWTYDPNVSDDILSSEDKRLIDEFERVYYRLSPKEHKINFNPDGSFILNVEYVPAPLEKIELTSDFKDGMIPFLVKSDEYSKRIVKIKDKIKLIKDNNKKLKAAKDTGLQSTIDNNNKLIKKLQEDLQNLSNQKSAFYAKEFLKIAKKYGAIVNYDTKIEKKEKQYNINFTLSAKNPLGDKAISKTFKTTYSVDKFSNIIPQALVTAGEANDEEFTTLLQTSERPAEIILNSVLKQQSSSGSFLFFKDIVRLAFLFSENSESFPDNDEMPYYIFGNIAYPLPNGRKFWCNIGDIAIEQQIFVNMVAKFFNIYPSATPKIFINFFTQKVIPEICVNRQNKVAFPRMASPFFPFNSSKYELDTKTNDNILKGLFSGDEKQFENFCTSYFKESDFESSTGCFFLGQANNLFYENSKIFISSKIKAFSENFFRSDDQLRKIGIGKLVLGSSNGLLKSMNFSSNSDDALTNLSYTLSQLKPEVADDIISTNFQYTVNAELFGNRIFDFSNLIYIPSYTLGKTTPALPDRDLTSEEIKKLREQARSNDFEIGGLYTVSNVTDTLQLSAGTYTKSIAASCIVRDSSLILNRLKKLEGTDEGKIIFPSTSLDVSLLYYIVTNIRNVKNILQDKLRKERKEREEADRRSASMSLGLEPGDPQAASNAKKLLKGPKGGVDVEAVVSKVDTDLGLSPEEKAIKIADLKSQGFSDKDIEQLGL